MVIATICSQPSDVATSIPILIWKTFNHLACDILSKMDSVVANKLSDLLINLSAGWFGAAIIVPFNVKTPKFKLWPLLSNLLFGIFAFLVATKLG